MQRQDGKRCLPVGGSAQGRQHKPLNMESQSCLTPCDPTDCNPPGSSVHGILQQEYWSGLPCPPPEGLPHPGVESRSPALQVDSLPSGPPGKSDGTAAGTGGAEGLAWRPGVRVTHSVCPAGRSADSVSERALLTECRPESATTTSQKAEPCDGHVQRVNRGFRLL